jgi:hypothetical protein
MALKMARLRGGLVTAGDVEAAVLKLNGKDQIKPETGLPVYNGADRI